MTVLRDIFDIIKDIDKDDLFRSMRQSQKYSSISKQSQEGILQFPVIVSRSLDIETSQMISKALERQYTSFAQVVFSMNPFINPKDNPNVREYLRKFHQNSDVKFGKDDILNTMTYFINESDTSALYERLDNENLVILQSKCYDGSTRSLIKENLEMLTPIYEGLNTGKLNDMSRTKNVRHVVKEDIQAKRLDQQISELEYRKQKDIDDMNYKRQRDYMNDLYNVGKAKDDNAFRNKQLDHQIKKDEADLKIKSRNLKDIDVTLVPQNILKDNDVKKSNELVPTTMHLRIGLINDEGSVTQFLDFIIGIKSTMHPVTSEEMIRNINSAVRGNNKVFDFIRWTTGEIKFLKDFIFNMDEIKTDVSNSVNGDSKWWLTLKRRKALSKLKNIALSKNPVLPNSTIVLSAQEVDLIRNEYNIDLMNTTIVDKLMSELFLLGFVIVDGSSQTAHFMFDGQKNFQTVTFGGLERENSNSKNEFKEMLKMVNRL